MDEKDLTKQIELYRELQEKNKGVDVNALIINSLEQKESKVGVKEKSHAYMVSLLLPPFGLIYVVKFLFFSDKDDAKMVAVVSLLLNVLGAMVFIVGLKAFLSSSGVTNDQLQQLEKLRAQDVIQLGQ